jgi:hypothetical protein
MRHSGQVLTIQNSLVQFSESVFRDLDNTDSLQSLVKQQMGSLTLIRTLMSNIT